MTRPDLADAGQRLEHTHDLQFREHVARLVAALGRIEQLPQGERADFELVLHLRTLATGNRRLLQRELTLLRCERGRVRHVVPPARRRDAILIRDATSRPESAATQHSETASVCNWSGVCTAAVLALVILERAHERVGCPLRGRTPIVGAGHRTSDHEKVPTGARDALGRADPCLIVVRATREPHTGNDSDEIGPRRMHTPDLVDRTNDAPATCFDRAREAIVERARLIP